jgi:hypothetical protein
MPKAYDWDKPRARYGGLSAREYCAKQRARAQRVLRENRSHQTKQAKRDAASHGCLTLESLRQRSVALRQDETLNKPNSNGPGSGLSQCLMGTGQPEEV